MFYENMYYWKIVLGGIDATAMLKEFISSLVVKYENQKPPIATVDISSPSFVEGIFTEGQQVEVWMGSNRLQFVEMFSGNIAKIPSGSATEIMNYKIQATGSANGARKVQIKNYDSSSKIAIISEIIIRAGYTPVIDIDDSSPVSAEDNVLQYAVTDLHFLNDLSLRWGAVFWIDTSKKIIYFIDEKKAHKYGDSVKLQNLNDIENDYVLSYRADNRINNVASVSWDSNSAAGPVEQGTEDFSIFSTDPDFSGDVTVYGQEYSLKPEWREAVKKDSSLNAKIIGMIEIGNKEKTNAILNKYFYKLGLDKERSKTRRPFASNGLKATVELNEPDFYLRPPRSAKLFDGSFNQNMQAAHLPDFLFSNPRVSTKFYINSVETGIRSGVGSTRMEMSR